MSNCSTCKYHYSYSPEPEAIDIPGIGIRDVTDHRRSKNECRFNAITVDGFPTTLDNNWCGQYKEKKE